MRVYRPKELSTNDGAQKNIALIRQYWWALGHHQVDAWPVRIGNDFSKKPIFGVRSNLVNGQPS